VIESPLEFKPRPPGLPLILFILAMSVVFGFYVSRDDALAPWIRVITPVGALAVIAVVLGLWHRRRNTRIVVDDAGITQRGMFRSRGIAWDDVESYRYLSVKQPIVAHGRGGSGLLGAVVGTLEERAAQRASGHGGYFGLGYIEFHRRGGGRPFRIGKDPFLGPQGGYDDITGLIEVIVDELTRRLRTDDFAPFLITQTALRHADGREIQHAQISRVELAAGKLVVFGGQPPAAWSTTAMQEVHNPLLLLRRLAQRGVPITCGQEVFVPPSVLVLD